jgi:chlorophyll(ide) b reductase
MDSSPAVIEQVVRTNLLGTLLATRAAMHLMTSQPTGGHIFNFEGAGSEGMATPSYAAYGATKAAIGQLLSTLQSEAAVAPGSPVAVHNLSPGMVLTDLLLDGATPENKRVFNILCEHPETVAAFLVPRARSVVARGQRGAAIRYLTPARAVGKFLSAPFRSNRYFDEQGARVELYKRHFFSIFSTIVLNSCATVCR